MSKNFAGKGRKRPQIDIPLFCLELDAENPRFAEECHGGTQLDLLKVLYRDFDLEDIGYSMAENGYFDEEPIVVIPKNLPKTFKWDEDINKVQADLEQLMNSNKHIKFIVIEGNRRIATAKLLTDEELRGKIKVTNDFPNPKGKGVEDDLKIIPAIVYQDKKDISPYLGVRHITGVLKWEAYAKAKYIATRVEEEKHKWKNIEKSIREVQKKVGDRTDVIKKQYMYYKIFEQARDDLEFDTEKIIDRFSLITVAISSPSIRDFIGVSSYKDAKFNTPLVPKNKFKNLGILLTWIFGNGKDKEPILTDSRKITSRLSPILADKEATEYLLTYGNLEEAYERSGGDKEFVKKKIASAKRAVTSALQSAYKYKDDKEIISLLEELDKAVEELKKAVTKK